jgi:hypothetical protein
MPDTSALSLPIYPESATFQVDLELKSTLFACDLGVCKGACCTMPAAAGAPILESEIAELERVLPIVRDYLPDSALEIIAENGVWQREPDGSLTIPAIRGRDCIFVTYDGDVALCGIEKAYRAGEVDWPKPISCHLFPIRLYPTGKTGEFEVLYEEISECRGGAKRGKREKIRLVDFLEAPLARAMGAERLARLKALLTP